MKAIVYEPKRKTRRSPTCIHCRRVIKPGDLILEHSGTVYFKAHIKPCLEDVMSEAPMDDSEVAQLFMRLQMDAPELLALNC